MKKTVLFLGLLGFATLSHAQTTPPANVGPWVRVNVVNSGAFSPGQRITSIKTVSPTVAWAVSKENTANNSKANYFFVTNNAAGDQFDFGSILDPVNGNPSFETSNIAAISATTALASNYGTPVGGEILRTSNAGISWTKVTTASQFAVSQGGFLDFVYMFDANEGVAVGDPTSGYFEILRTTNGGTTWTRIPSQPALIPAAGEAALTGSFFGLGNTIWFGGATLNDNHQERVFKSVDRGITWTVSGATPLTASINSFAFKDQQNGIAFNQKVSGTPATVTAVNVIRTSDGGATWSTITPVNTATGSFFYYDIDAVNGRYYSVGQRFPASSPGVAADFGSSYSTDGINWTNVNNSQGFFAFDVVPGTAANTAAGYAGASTDMNGVGGLYKSTDVRITASRDAALQSALTVHPNPSATGLFNVDLGSFLQAGAQLTVSDALGRLVKTQALNATAVGSKTMTLDLSGEKTGVYTLQIRTEAGLATKKLVIE